MRVFGFILGGLGGVLLLLGLSWFGYGLYLSHVVSANPGTALTLQTESGEVQLGAYQGGDQVVPPGPGEPSPSPSPAAVASLASPTVPTPTPRPTPSQPALPPTRLRIPKIGVDWPVVLADNDNLPRFKGVGWFIGTGYPGFRGNVVLFGHLNGQYETFARLGELRSGDAVEVDTSARALRYVVGESKVVPAEAVEVLAPTADRRLTLITCAGTFNPADRTYSHRLVVTATLGE